MPKIAAINLASFYIFLQLLQMSRCLPGGTLGTYSPFSSDRAAYTSCLLWPWLHEAPSLQGGWLKSVESTLL